MHAIRSCFVTLCAILLGGFEAISQDETRVRVDPGVSVHNYKHSHKAKKAQMMQKVPRRSRFSSRVGIVPRSVNTPRAITQVNTPKYRRRSVLSFFRGSNPTPTRLNPLTNPGNYKTQH
ncbi:hypothetical protein [Persicitalea sp.]|uniref:hypothetical protein n=1 Tax=Persicitalea sp. TaxID=3100273 RepID=UPI00359460E4